MYKRSLRLSLALGALFLSFTYLLHGADAPAGPVDASQAKAKEELVKLESDWATAEDRHDEATLRRILDEKFVVTLGTKTPPYNKEGFIKAVLAGDVDPTKSQTLSDQTVIVDGDTGVVVATDTERGTKKGEAFTVAPLYGDLHSPKRAMGCACGAHSYRATGEIALRLSEQDRGMTTANRPATGLSGR